MNNSRSWVESLFLGTFVMVVFYTLWAATVGWGTPILQQYEFVQAKAAIVAYYLAHGGPILRYEMPVQGPPWSVPYEFPFYQIIAAWLHNLTGWPLESAGRVVGKIFFYLSCLPLFVIARAIGFRGKAVLIPLTIFLASPIYLFWSRQFMIESTALFFGLSYLAAVMAWGKNSGKGKLLLAVFLGVLAALAKSTTYATFALAAGIFLGAELLRNRNFSASHIFRCLFILGPPLLAGLWWVHFTDDVKSLNPLAADFHTSKALAKWYLHSDWSERLNGAFWYRLFRITIHDSIGHRAAWIVSVLLAISLGRRAWLYWLCSGLFLVAPALFTHAHLLHDYYANANAVFLVFGVAVLVERAISSEKTWMIWGGVALFFVVIGYEVRDFMGKGYLQQQEVKMAPIDFAKKLQPIVAPQDVLMMFGEDWCPTIPYFAERRAIMLWKGGGYDSKLERSLALLRADGKKVGAVVLCHEARKDPEFLGLPFIGPLLLRDHCDVYAYQDKR